MRVALAKPHSQALAAGAGEAALLVRCWRGTVRREVSAGGNRGWQHRNPQVRGCCKTSAHSNTDIHSRHVSLSHSMAQLRLGPSRTPTPPGCASSHPPPPALHPSPGPPQAQPPARPPVEVQARHERQQALQLLPRVGPLAVRCAVRVGQRADELLHPPDEAGAQLPAAGRTGRAR